MKNHMLTLITVLMLAVFGYGCSEPDKGTSELKFSIQPSGSRVHGPYGVMLVVPEGAVDESCSASMMLSNMPPKPYPDGTVASICVFLDTDDCGKFDKDATLQIPLFDVDDSANLEGEHTSSANDGWEKLDINLPNNGMAQMQIQEGGFYVIMEK